MDDQNNLSEVGQRWSGWARIIGAAIALAVFLLGGGFFYSNIWNNPVLSYTLLPEYDLGGQVFSGIVIENRGRVPLTDVRILMADLDNAIEALNMPGAHEPAQIVEGGEGEAELHLLAPQLSTGKSLSVYLLTDGPLELDSDQLLVTSKETVGKFSGTESNSIDLVLVVLAAASLLIYVRGLIEFYRYMRR